MLFRFIYFYFNLHMPTVVDVWGNQFVIIWITSHNRSWSAAEVTSSARQTGRLNHLSYTWQQQNSWNSRKLLLRDKGHSWRMMKICVGVLWKRQLNSIYTFRTSDGSRWVGSGKNCKAWRSGLRCWFW